MSQTSEAKRLVEIKQNKVELSAADRFRQRVEERSVTGLSKNAEQGKERDALKKADNEIKGYEELGHVDEYQRLKADADFLRLADWLAIDTKQLDDARNHMLFVMEWAKENCKEKDLIGVLGYLKRVRSDIGFKEVGLSGLKKFYQYARLDSDAKRIEREKRLLKEK